MIAAFVFLALFRWKLGMLKTLAAIAAAGVVWIFVTLPQPERQNTRLTQFSPCSLPPVVTRRAGDLTRVSPAPTTEAEPSSWEKTMTVCIAAACTDGMKQEPRIVLCADELASTDVSSSQTEFKFVQLPRFVGMFAGVISEARELFAAYERHLRQKEGEGALSSLSADEWLRVLRLPLEMRHRELRRHFAAKRTGLSLEEFHKLPTDRITSKMREVEEDIESRVAEADLLIAGFIEKSPAAGPSLICRVRMGRAEMHTNFACIGIGADTAEQSLHRRGQSDLLPLARTMYHVYEAKRMSEQSPRIGQQTTMGILFSRIDEHGEQNYRIKIVGKEGMNFLEECYERYGPQPTEHLTIRPDQKIYLSGEVFGLPPSGGARRTLIGYLDEEE